MICLSKFYDSYLWPEVCFFRSVFTHLQGLQPPFRQSSERTWPPPSLRTKPQIPGLSSQQKGKERPLHPSDRFHSRIWKCFKNVKYGAWTKNPNYLSLSFFLSPFLLRPLCSSHLFSTSEEIRYQFPLYFSVQLHFVNLRDFLGFTGGGN